MAFINTIDSLGDDAVFDSIINGTITEFKDDTVSRVGQYAFYKCTALETVDVPNADDVDMCAFQNCSSLKTANIPEATRVNQWAFGDCKALTDITAPKVTRIDANAFRGCHALNSVNFPLAELLDPSCFASCIGLKRADFSRIKSISGTVFHNCTSLVALILRNTDAVATLASGAIGGPIADGTGYIYVPSALYDSYRAASGWSTYTNQFRKLEEWTVDGTVTGELDLANRHMVRFFNSDGTLLSYVVVPTGGTAVYVGDTPVNPNGDDPFDGFDLEPVNVTADMDCYARYFDPSVAQWEAVFASIAAGTYATDYAIGDTVPLNLGSEGVINMQIVAFDADDLADGSGKAPITWLSKELLKTDKRMNPSLSGYQEGTGSIGGWEKTEMRAYLKGTIKPLMLEVVRNSIKEVTKTQEAYDTAGTKFTQTSIEDVWLPDYNEMFGSSSPYKSMFPDSNSRKKSKVGATSAYYWWLRSPTSTVNFNCVNSNGNGSYGDANLSNGVTVGFCT